MTRRSRHHSNMQRASFLDVMHICVLLACSIWTATLVVKERFGSFGGAATRLSHLSRLAHRTGSTVTIRLDDGARTAAR